MEIITSEQIDKSTLIVDGEKFIRVRNPDIISLILRFGFSIVWKTPPIELLFINKLPNESDVINGSYKFGSYPIFQSKFKYFSEKNERGNPGVMETIHEMVYVERGNYGLADVLGNQFLGTYLQEEAYNLIAKIENSQLLVFVCGTDRMLNILRREFNIGKIIIGKKSLPEIVENSGYIYSINLDPKNVCNRLIKIGFDPEQTKVIDWYNLGTIRVGEYLGDDL